MSNTPFAHKLVTPKLMWAVIALGCAVSCYLLPATRLFQVMAVSWVLVALAAVNWVYFIAGALKVNRTAVRSAAGVPKVVTTGVYAKVRHPLYSTHIRMMWILLLVLPDLRFLGCIVWTTVVLLAWMMMEEKALEEKFGDDYARYKRRTPMIFPRYFGGGH